MCKIAGLLYLINNASKTIIISIEPDLCRFKHSSVPYNGTLSEIAIALKLGKPMIGINTWENIDCVVKVDNAEDAVAKAFELANKKM